MTKAKRREILKVSLASAGALASGPAAWPQDSRANSPGVHQTFSDTASDMKIKVSSVQPFMIKGARMYAAWNLVRLRTEDGTEGIGEGFAYTGGRGLSVGD